MANTSTDVRLVGIRRAAKDPKRSAEFYAWLLDLVPEPAGDGFRLSCTNGEFIIHSDVATPVGIHFQASNAQFLGHDLDSIPVAVASEHIQAGGGAVRLDHISLNCANLADSIAFYRGLGLVISWSGTPPDYENSRSGFQEEPLPGADWVHLSGADGYLALSQADWRNFGIHNANSGPPRFVHVGFVLPDLASIAARLEAAGIATLQATPNPLGDQLYFNDPDGDARLGSNVELVQYEPGVPRSGEAPY